MAAFITHFSRFYTGVSNAARKIRDPKTSPDSIKSILDNIKKELISAPALKSANFDDDLLIFTDASDYDCSGVVFQRKKNGKLELVTCFSRKFPDAMLKKSIYEKELWCLQQITKTFRYLFIGNHRKIFFNDNKAVLAAKKSRAPSLNCLFNYIETTFSNVTFKFVPTKKNAADIFTRQLVNSIKMNQSLKDKIMSIHVKTGCYPTKKILVTMKDMPEYNFVTASDIDEVLSKCELCAQVQNHKKPRKACPGITLSKEVCTTDVLYIDHKQILNNSRKQKIMSRNVNSDPDFSPILDESAENKKSSKTYNSILTVVEPVSNLTWFREVEGYTGDEVKKCLREYFMFHGTPKTIVADNAPCFTSLKTWLKDCFNTELCHTSAYHPNSNLAERCHREFEKVMNLFDSSSDKFNFEDWENSLAMSVCTTNSLKHSVYKLSPYEIHKNRIMCEVEPPRYFPVGMEQRLNGEKLSNKFDKVLKSKGKVILPVFTRDQIVKVAFTDEPIRYGKVKSTRDMAHKTAVRISFNGKKAIGVNKNFICLPRSGVSSQPVELPDSANIDEDVVTVPSLESVQSPVILDNSNLIQVPVIQAPEVVQAPNLPQIVEATVPVTVSPQVDNEVPDARTLRRSRRARN